MLTRQFEVNNDLIKDILDAPLGHVVTVLESNLDCNIKLDLIEQNTSKPDSKFERKIMITANNLPLIKAVIKFDRKILPKHIVNQLLQKKNLVGTILDLNDIPNKKDIIFALWTFEFKFFAKIIFQFNMRGYSIDYNFLIYFSFNLR